MIQIHLCHKKSTNFHRVLVMGRNSLTQQDARPSFGRPRSTPARDRQSTPKPITSPAKQQPSLTRSLSASNIEAQSKHKSRMKNLNLGAGNEQVEEAFVTRHMLYKEAVYTGAHLLGKETERFPCSKEDLCLYAHEAFGVSKHEQQAVIEHVKSELYPLIGVNLTIIKGESLVSTALNEPQRVPNPYCLITLQNEQHPGAFLSRQEFGAFQATVKGRFTITKILRRASLKNDASNNNNSHRMEIPPPPEKRLQQYNRLQGTHKTAVFPRERDPVWEQTFQVVSAHPSADNVIIEVWDRIEDDTYSKAVEAFAKSHHVPAPSGNTKSSGSTAKGKDDKATTKSPQGTAGDIFLGKVELPVSEIPCEGLEKLVELEGSGSEVGGRIRLRVWLVHLYRHGKHTVEMTDKYTMLSCLWDWILAFEKKLNGDGSEWDGSIPTQATCLLYQYALQTGISEESHSYIRWEAFAKHKLDMEGLDSPLRDLDHVLTKKKQRSDDSIKNLARKQSASTIKKAKSLQTVPSSQSQSSVKTAAAGPLKDPISTTQTSVENSIMKLMEDEIYPIIRNHNNEPEERLSKALKSFKNSTEVLSKFDVSFALPLLQGMMEKALRLSFLEWYESLYKRRIGSVQIVSECELIKLYVEVVTEVNQLVNTGAARFHPSFFLLANYESYLPIMYEELQKMVSSDVEALCHQMMAPYTTNARLRHVLHQNRKEDVCKVSALFSLYAGTQQFVESQVALFNVSSPHLYPNLLNYYKWFRPILVLWLGFAVIKGSDMISRCINLDTVAMDNVQHKTSTSALDTATVLHQLIRFWEKLNWPDVTERYVIIHFILEVAGFLVALYAERKLEKLEIEGYFDTIDQFDISDRLCTALNNIEYVKDAFSAIPDEVKYPQLMEELEAACGNTALIKEYRDRVTQLITYTHVNVDLIFDSILDGIRDRVRPEISRCVRETLGILQLYLTKTSKELLSESLDPILSYVDGNIVTLSESLLSLNFARMLQLFWNLIVQEFVEVGGNIEFQSAAEQAALFEKILLLIPLLQDYFQNEDGGLSNEEMATVEYETSREVLDLYTKPTPDVISYFYWRRGQYQEVIDHSHQAASHPRFGVLTVRVAFWQGKLSVEVIAAHELYQPHNFDLWTMCKKNKVEIDPYVEISFHPETQFSNVRLSRTTTKWNIENPVFNEKFQWDVSQQEATNKNAVLLFTVKDYNYLRKNDFLGEAVLPFEMVPGVSDKQSPQPMHLTLRNVTTPAPVLHLFSTRKWDPEALKFYDLQQKRRIAAEVKDDGTDKKIPPSASNSKSNINQHP